MIEICLVGACGRMGKRITAAVAQSEDLRLVAAVETKGHPLLGQDIGQVAGISPLGVTVGDDLGSALSRSQLVIDFSLPDSVVRTAELCWRNGIPLVTGVTGIPEEGAEILRRAAKEIAVVWAPNMSVGVNLMFKVASEVASVLGAEFDVEIVEIHHRFKKDAPSGTARRLAEVIAASLGRNLEEVACYGRRGLTGERDPNQIEEMMERLRKLHDGEITMIEAFKEVNVDPYNASAVNNAYDGPKVLLSLCRQTDLLRAYSTKETPFGDLRPLYRKMHEGTSYVKCPRIVNIITDFGKEMLKKEIEKNVIWFDELVD